MWVFLQMRFEFEIGGLSEIDRGVNAPGSQMASKQWVIRGEIINHGD